MNVLYKYTRFFGINELVDNHLRLSLTSTLNDPFESTFNEKLENEMLRKFNIDTFKLKVPEHVPNWVKQKLTINNIKSIKDLYGIISLSETPRNLLMWAHYASEHTGICIGYKSDMFKSLTNKPSSKLGLEEIHPIKVNYDNLRPHELRRTDLNEAEILNELKNHFITKSDDWIYEKEHRYIIPIKWASKIKLLGETDDVDGSLVNVISHYEMQGSIVKIGNESSDEYMVKHSHPFHKYALDEKNVAYLINVNPSDIVSIHLGCKIKEQHEDIIRSYVKSKKSKLGHVKILKATPSRRRFELDID